MNRTELVNTFVNEAMTAPAGVHAAFVEGAAGSGKTHLLQEVSRGLSDRATVLVGECLASGTPPLLPLCAAIARSPRLRRDGESSALIRRYAEAIPLVKDWIAPALLASSDTMVGPAPLLGTPPPPSFVFLALSRLLQRASRSEPVVLLVDDVQWIDESTLAALEFLVREGAEGIVLLGLFCRTGDPERPIAVLRDAAIHAGVRVAIDTALEGLSREEFLAVVQSVMGGALVASLAAIDQLRTQAHGSPLYAQELARLLLDRGDVVRKDGLFVLKANTDAALRAPSLQRLTRLRIERAIGVSEPRRRVLFALATLGRPAPTHHVATVAGMSAAAVLAEASELVRTAGLLKTQAHAGGQYLAFEHDVIRESVIEMIGTMGPLFHATAARSLATDAAIEPSTIARHFELAQETDEAREWWGRAADAGLSAWAVPDALQFAQRAEALATESASKVSSAVRTARCLFAAEQYEAVIAHLRPQLVHATDDELAAIALPFCRSALRLPQASSHRVAIDVAESALRRGGARLAAADQCDYQLTLLCLHDAVGDHVRAKGAFQRARAIARAAGDPRLASRAERLGCIFAQPEIMVDRLERVERDLDPVHDVAEVGYVANNRGTALMQLNRLGESLASLERAERHLRTAGGYRVDVPLNNQGVVCALQDRPAAARRFFEDARTLNVDSHNRIFIDVNIAVMDAMGGRVVQAEQGIRLALTSARDSGDDFYIDVCTFNLARLMTDLGRFLEAIEILETTPLRTVTTDEVLVRGQRALLVLEARRLAGMEPAVEFEEDVRRLQLSTKPQAWLYQRKWHLCDIEFWED